MQQKINEIRSRALEELKRVSDSRALDELRVRLLGKKGELTGILRSMGQVAAEMRPQIGQWVNEARESIEGAIAQAQAEERRSLAVAAGQEMVAKTTEMNAQLTGAKSAIPTAVAGAFQRPGALRSPRLRPLVGDQNKWSAPQ